MGGRRHFCEKNGGSPTLLGNRKGVATKKRLGTTELGKLGAHDKPLGKRVKSYRTSFQINLKYLRCLSAMVNKLSVISKGRNQNLFQGCYWYIN